MQPLVETTSYPRPPADGINPARKWAWSALLVLSMLTGCDSLLGKSTSTHSQSPESAPQEKRLWEDVQAEDERTAARDWQPRGTTPAPMAVQGSARGTIRQGTLAHSPAGTDANMTSGSIKMIQPTEKYQRTKQALLELAQQPDPRALPFLEDQLRGENAAFATFAAVALTKLRGIEAEQLLWHGARDKRSDVRKAALAGLIDLRAPKVIPHCRAALQSDPHPQVRATAASGLGLLRDLESKPLLVQAMDRGVPAVSFAAGWALAYMQDERGYRYLTLRASNDNPRAALPAIQALGALQTPEAARILIQNLYASEDEIWRASLAALAATAPEVTDRAIADLPKSVQGNMRLKQGMLDCLLGRAKLPLETLMVLQTGERKDKLLALRCIEHAGSAQAIPFLIDALDDESAKVSENARAALNTLAQRLAFPKIPEKNHRMRAWWFRLHTLGQTSLQEAQLRDPRGQTRLVRVGDKLEWDAEIVKILPAGGPQIVPRLLLQLGPERIELQGPPMTRVEKRIPHGDGNY